MTLDDTIAAVSTPLGRGGIGVVRMSGLQSIVIAQRVLSTSDPDAYEANHAFVADVTGDDESPLDKTVVTCFRAPRSFTGEDTVEISCHGSPVVMRSILSRLLAEGARLATEGEFTLRAFVNGRLDLTQAEAIRDLIDAQTEHQARSAQRQARGEISRRLSPLKERLLSLIVQLETTVEFVEDDLEPANRAALIDELSSASTALRSLAESYDLGKRIVEGVSIAFVGPPNAGKSSLFNALLELDRAIVTPIAGTTRDLVSERVVLDGIPLRLIDTAGLRETEDAVESIGIDRTRSAIADADIVVVVLDAAGTREETAARLLAETAGLRRIVVSNKCDLGPAVSDTAGTAMQVSALTGEGLDVLRARLSDLARGGRSLDADAFFVTNVRHFGLLMQASENLESAREALASGLSEEVALVGLHAALRDLGELTGETAIDDILNRIFSTFCIGK